MSEPMEPKLIVELTSADIPAALRNLNRAGIGLTDVVQTGDLSVRMAVDRKDYHRLEAMTQRRGESLRLLRRMGKSWKIGRLLRHPVLVLGILLLVAATMLLPTRVLFIRVEGNAAVPTALILEKAEQCGVAFGTVRSGIRSEKIKNALLDAIPQLQWAGVNTSGCVATITVRERRQEETQTQPAGIGSIVAVRDGVVRECTVSWGTALCKAGQAVRAGETLVSGYMDCGGAILSGMAEGEVYAETNRQLLVLTAENALLRGEEQSREQKISLIIGKNRINFYQDSGILDATCVKMYSEYYLTLPGGFQLPAALVVEEWIRYDCSVEAVPDEAMAGTLSAFAQRYLGSQMTAGRILEKQETVSGSTLYGNYICHEMIGQIRYEEITDKYGEIDGENG